MKFLLFSVFAIVLVNLCSGQQLDPGLIHRYYQDEGMGSVLGWNTDVMGINPGFNSFMPTIWPSFNPGYWPINTQGIYLPQIMPGSQLPSTHRIQYASSLSGINEQPINQGTLSTQIAGVSPSNSQKLQDETLSGAQPTITPMGMPLISPLVNKNEEPWQNNIIMPVIQPSSTTRNYPSNSEQNYVGDLEAKIASIKKLIDQGLIPSSNTQGLLQPITSDNIPIALPQRMGAVQQPFNPPSLPSYGLGTNTASKSFLNAHGQLPGLNYVNLPTMLPQNVNSNQPSFNSASFISNNQQNKIGNLQAKLAGIEQLIAQGILPAINTKELSINAQVNSQPVTSVYIPRILPKRTPQLGTWSPNTFANSNVPVNMEPIFPGIEPSSGLPQKVAANESPINQTNLSSNMIGIWPPWTPLENPPSTTQEPIGKVPKPSLDTKLWSSTVNTPKERTNQEQSYSRIHIRGRDMNRYNQILLDYNNRIRMRSDSKRDENLKLPR